MRILSDEKILDNNGKLVQTHGGSMMVWNNKIYWYGENKEGNFGPRKNKDGEVIWPLWSNGLKIYSSNNMVDWLDEGFVKEASDNPWNPLYTTYIVDRPHIVYCKKTNKFVCWVKTSYDIYLHCGFTILVGDSPINMKYKCLLKPEPHWCGDFDLFEHDGKGYIVYANNNCEMILRELSDDYESLTDNWQVKIKQSYPPFTREAPCFFERNGRMFIITSGTTGYFPNRTKTYEISDLFGEWKDLGYTCVDDEYGNSFRAQFSSVFKHPSIPDLYIAIGDRWLVDLPEKCPDIEYLFERIYNPERTWDYRPFEDQLNSLSKQRLCDATYVILPIKFRDDGTPYIEYKKEWEL